MYLHETHFVPYGKVNTDNIQALKEHYLKYDDSVWDVNTTRQDVHFVHKKTKSIVFRFLVDIDKVNSSVEYKMWPEFRHFLEPIIAECQSFFEHETKLNRCCMAKLPAGADIPAHVDAASSFDNVHRIHIPLFTNPDVEFIVDRKRVIMDEDHAYEINNKLMHGVINNGDKDRIHLIIDLLKL